MHYGALVCYASNDVGCKCNQDSAQTISITASTEMDSSNGTHIKPKTLPGPTSDSIGAAPLQETGDRASKKYVHSSGLAPTNDIETLGFEES